MRKPTFLILTGIIFSVSITLVTSLEEPIAQTPNGKISGTFRKTEDDKTYMEFLGIPYAKPPINTLRFQPPQPADPWPGTWVANMTCQCIQVNMQDEPQEGGTMGQEDCLYVNVYVPGNRIDPSKKLDVIVHIHGGGFMFGSASGYSHPRSLMNRNIIFVTFNYRLGLFGFLSTEDRYLPGNLGMKDQNMVLQWIQKNIKSFGGNPESVTITGLSAGGASVQYHLLSPMSRGLFHKAISVSGSVLNQWTQQKGALTKAKMLGEIVGCIYKNSKDFVDCLKSKPALQLVEATKLFRKWAYIPFSPFAPVVDDQAEVPFLPRLPYKMLEDGEIYDVPWITSVTTDEGLFPVAQLFVRKEYFDQLRENWDEYLALMLHYDYTLPKNQWSDVAVKIKEEYLGCRDVSFDTHKEIIQLASDRLFVADLEDASRMLSKAIKSPTYFYQFNFTADNIPGFAETLFYYKEKYGVGHGDDIMLIYDSGVKGTPRDDKMSKFLIDMWVNFAHTGNPGVDGWTPINKNPKEPLDYLYVSDEIEMKQGGNLGHNDFWRNLPFAANENVMKKNIRVDL